MSSLWAHFELPLISLWLHFDVALISCLISPWFHVDFNCFHRDFTLNSLWLHCGFTLSSHWFHFEFTLISLLISLWLHFDFTFDLKGKGKGHGKKAKGKASHGQKGKGKRSGSVLRLILTRQWTPRARTNETKRFPGHGGKALAALTPPNLRLMYVSHWHHFSIQLRFTPNLPPCLFWNSPSRHDVNSFAGVPWHRTCAQAGEKT